MNNRPACACTEMDIQSNILPCPTLAHDILLFTEGMNKCQWCDIPLAIIFRPPRRHAYQCGQLCSTSRVCRDPSRDRDSRPSHRQIDQQTDKRNSHNHARGEKEFNSTQRRLTFVKKSERARKTATEQSPSRKRQSNSERGDRCCDR